MGVVGAIAAGGVVGGRGVGWGIGRRSFVGELDDAEEEEAEAAGGFGLAALELARTGCGGVLVACFDAAVIEGGELVANALDRGGQHAGCLEARDACEAELDLGEPGLDDRVQHPEREGVGGGAVARGDGGE